MKPLKLTLNGRSGYASNSPREVLINWDNVDFVLATNTAYGDPYTEVHCNKQTLDVRETVEEIEVRLGNLGL